MIIGRLENECRDATDYISSKWHLVTQANVPNEKRQCAVFGLLLLSRQTLSQTRAHMRTRHPHTNYTHTHTHRQTHTHVPQARRHGNVVAVNAANERDSWGP